MYNSMVYMIRCGDYIKDYTLENVELVNIVECMELQNFESSVRQIYDRIHAYIHMYGYYIVGNDMTHGTNTYIVFINMNFKKDNPKKYGMLPELKNMYLSVCKYVEPFIRNNKLNSLIDNG